MRKIIVIVWILSSLLVLAEGVYIFSDEIYGVKSIVKSNVLYVRASDLSPLGFDFSGDPSKGVYYLFYKDHILVLRSSGVVERDFIEVLDVKGAVFQGGEVYVKANLIESFTGKRWERLASGGYGMFLVRRVVISYELSDGKIVMNFNAKLVPEMVRISSTGENRYSVYISPVHDSVIMPKNLNASFSGDALVIHLEGERGFIPKFSVDGKRLTIIYSVVEKEFFGSYKIWNGLVWKRVKEQFNGKEYIVDYLDVDLDWIKAVPEVAQRGIGTLETVASMVQREGALAGVNANYFDPKTGMIIGLLVKDGMPLSTPYGGRPIFVITDENEALIDKVYVEIQLQINDLMFLVKGVNTINKGEVKIYTKEYGKNLKPENDKMYLLVKGGIIVKKGFKFPLGYGEILLEFSSKFKEYLKDVDLGTPVRVVVRSSFDLPIKHAIEGGPLLLYDGKPIRESMSEKYRYGGGIPYARAPRTIVAIKDRKHFSLIVIEQNGSHPGMNYDEMVEFLEKKGYVSAMCFDGGSSTSLVVHGKTVNFTKTGRKPYVAAALLLFPR